MVEDDTVFCQTVEVWRPYDRVSRPACQIGTVFIGHEEQNVGMALLLHSDGFLSIPY